MSSRPGEVHSKTLTQPKKKKRKNQMRGLNLAASSTAERGKARKHAQGGGGG
jgi:hypothetical protein